MRKAIYLSLLAFSMMSATGALAEPAPPVKESATITLQSVCVQSAMHEVVLVSPCNYVEVETVQPALVLQVIAQVSDPVPVISDNPVLQFGNSEVLPPLQLSRLITYGMRSNNYWHIKADPVNSKRSPARICGQNSRC